MYINSPGGSIVSGLAIYDTMKYIKCDITTIVTGRAASMGSIISAAGTKGKRLMLPNSSMMIHQPSSGYNGTASDIERAAAETLYWKKRTTEILTELTYGVTDIKKMATLLDRDTFLRPDETIALGLADRIITRRGEPTP